MTDRQLLEAAARAECHALQSKMLDENKTIYDRRAQVDERAMQAAPMLYAALKALLDAVEERPALADSIESITLQDARQLIENLRS